MTTRFGKCSAIPAVWGSEPMPGPERFLLFFSFAAAACAVDLHPPDAGQASFPSEVEPDFLVSDGIGTAESAAGYYASLDPSLVLGEYTLDAWLDEYIADRPTHQSLYQNAKELGFWREMKCTQYIGRGIGGCMVRNWADPSEVDSGVPDLGTVTMNVSAEGITRFYVFAPGGALSPAAILDDEGEKFVPHVCIACHNGSYEGTSQGSDLRAVFREFEPSMLEAAPGQGNASTEWYQLNQVVRSANTSLRAEAEGATAGIDHAKAAQASYIRAMYTSTVPIQALDVRSPAHLPPSWGETLNVPPKLVAAKRKLFTDLVNPYCMTCHRTNDTDWGKYEQFELLAQSVDGKSFLDYYIAPPDEREEGIPFMPQAKLLYEELIEDTSARAAIDNWIEALGSPVCAPGMECTPQKACHSGEVLSCGPVGVACTAVAPSPNGTPCGSESTCHNGSCVPTLTISIPQVPPRIYVRNEGPQSPESHVHLSVGGGKLLVRTFDSQNLCVVASSVQSLNCNISTLTCKSPSTGDSWKVVGPGMLTRTNPGVPDLEGTYRIESPLTVPDC